MSCLTSTTSFKVVSTNLLHIVAVPEPGFLWFAAAPLFLKRLRLPALKLFCPKFLECSAELELWM